MANNVYLKFDPEVKGESGDQGFVGQIQVDSVIFGASTVATLAAAGGGKAKVSVNDVNFTKRTDLSTPILLNRLVLGTKFNTAEFTFVKSAGSGQALAYMRCVLKDAKITALTMTSAANEIPMESVTISFGAVSIEYKEQTRTGLSGLITAFQYDLTGKT